MKRFLLSAILLLAIFAGVRAQEWSKVLTNVNGLPGIALDDVSYDGFYEFTSTLIEPGTPSNKVRITVLETINNEAPNGNNIIFALSELKIYDKDGNSLPYIATSNADHNSMSYVEDGGGLPALSDGDYKSYFHSMWTGNDPVTDYHYVELSLEKSVDSFSLEWATRLGEPKNAPTKVAITLGTDYVPVSVGDEFVLGDAVTTAEELAVGNRLFVLKGNAVKSFTASNGTTYTGSGPLYMRYAEEGDIKPSAENALQLIPFDAERYIIYWPISGKYLANSASSYNGLNGWQYSTTYLSKAAYVKITPVGGGKFELQYDGVNSAGAVSLYVGAEMRDGVDSKMKTFDLEHKTALENGDYTKGYSLPIDFGWEIYKAVLDDETVAELMLSLTDYARTTLQPVIDEANAYLSEYGDFEGDCAGEDTELRSVISMVSGTIGTANSFSEIVDARSNLLVAISRYMAVGLKKYERRVAELESTATYSSYPYVVGTYPESSKSILESISSAISAAKDAAGIYTAEQYENLFAQIESDITRFESTKVESSDGSGGGEEGDKDEEEATEGDILYVYLADGDVDAYSAASLDGDYYEENGKLYFPIKDGDVIYYNREEYDSCSTVRPELPYMTSFKFNNKYNPNLNVDAIAETVSQDMYFSLNAIGKWLTASFQLSDDKAVAYVDTVLQESKVTRQSFADKVTYKVTYPGYNIVERVKVQDELWTNPVANGDTDEVVLTADMLSTNKPSQNSSESLANLLDNNPSTIFHSTWGSANNATLNINTYIEIDLPEQLENIQIYYKCRPQSGYNPLVWEIYASEDGNMWTLVRTLDYTKDNMPTGRAGQEYTSPTISLGKNYSKLRILQTSGEYSKNHFVLSELRIYKVLEGTTEEPEKIQDAVYENRKIPFGREYDVTIEWLTENAISVPRIDIDIDGGAFVTSKDYYLNAKFRITGYGVYDNFEDSVQIKGRGNSSWGYSKKPYRLKFAEKVKPFGLTKGKSWVLLANAQRGSLMANAISMKIGQIAGAHYTNHIIPVDLYMNGRYMGSYMFTEKVGMANNSVDIDEELGYLLELDTYGSSDEPINRTGVYNLPVKIAEPDLEDYTSDVAAARKEAMIKDVREMSAVVFDGGDLETVLDVDALARFYLANDFSLNQEINHPKSTFLYKNEGDPEGKLTFGPIWDFDWGYGYETTASYCYSNATSTLINYNMAAHGFWDDISNNVTFKKNYYKVWKEFLDNNGMEELEDYIDSYYNFAKNSFDSNAVIWSGNGYTETDRDRAKQWLKERKNYIYNNLTEYDIDDLLHPLAGDVNCDDVVTVHDVALITAYLNGHTHKAFHEGKADVDGDGSIGASDAEATANLVLDGDAPTSMYWYSTPAGEGMLAANDFEVLMREEQNIPLVLSSGSNETYSAIQFDIAIPDGFDIYDVTIGDVECPLTYTQKDMNNFRVVAYLNDNSEFSTGDEIIAKLTVTTNYVIEEDARKLVLSNIYAVDANNDEVRLENSTISFTQATSVGSTYATYSVKGGECITVTTLKAQEIAVYSVDGRLVRKFNAKEGTTRIEVPQGVYIVNGEKAVVY
ncbi:MAG: CotH kinase family protein [Bacteroidaceae bacterium]|nr:CotH kinase family protein [Bacteroidaceae bacterium]